MCIIYLTSPPGLCDLLFGDDMHTWGRSVLGVNMAIKEYKTIDEQIALLRSRGLAIADEELAKDFLLRNNYYRISGYSLDTSFSRRVQQKRFFPEHYRYLLF